MNRFLSDEHGDLEKKTLTQQFRFGMLVLMMGFEDAYKKLQEEETKQSLEEHVDEIRRLCAKGAATVVLSIAKTLPQIVNPLSIKDIDDI